jgi:TldD protein
MPPTYIVDEAILSRTIDAALKTGGEFAEVFVEDRRSTSASLDDGRVEQVSSGRSRGAGVRVVSGDTTGFAHTTDLSEGGLAAAAEAASAAARRGGGGTNSVPFAAVTGTNVAGATSDPSQISKSRKVELLERADAAARASGGAVKQVSAGYGDGLRRIQVANSEGVLAADERIRTRFSVSVVASGDAGMQTGYESIGFTRGFEVFDDITPEQIAAEGARRALAKLDAKPAPTGRVPVVIAAGVGGVLFHEACGHGLEADHIQKGASVYAGKVGELVASPLVTLVDDGTWSHEWGSSAIDDEGHPTGRNVLIENGVLTEFMWDWLRCRQSNRAGTGNGRRETYQVLPMVRMTNTYLTNGTADPEEIVRQTPNGVYVAKLGGGQVNTTTGDFVFGMTEAYLIEDGRITAPLRDANLIGNGPEVLRNIDVVGNDFSMGGPGTCGKEGQGVPVGLGQPTLRITEITVGGTAGA